jgi:plasmid stabilization system protein ParE
MKIRILSAARQDLLGGFRFYEAQQQGLGAYFLDSLFADIDSLQLYAGIHPVVAGGFQRLLAKRFPFAIYYRRDNQAILVYAVLDCRRNPAWNRKRLRGNNP